jgi:hypothetical protein
MTARDLNGEKSNYSVPPKTLQVLPSLHCSLHHLRRRPPSCGVHSPYLQHDTGAMTLVHTKRANASHYCWPDGLLYISHKVKVKVQVRLSLCTAKGAHKEVKEQLLSFLHLAKNESGQFHASVAAQVPTKQGAVWAHRTGLKALGSL